MRGSVCWLFVALAGLGPLAAGAQADCPSAIARDGVWFEFADRAVLSRVLSDGRVEEMEFPVEGGAVYGYVTLPIGLLVESWTLVDGRLDAQDRETVVYAGTPDPVPQPAPGVRFDGVETSRFPDGQETRYTVSLTVGEARPVAIGPCSYTGLPVAVTRIELGGGPVLRDSMMFLTELGLTIFLGFSDSGEPPVDELPVSIGLFPPPGSATVPTASDLLPPPPLPVAPGGGAELPAK